LRASLQGQKPTGDDCCKRRADGGYPTTELNHTCLKAIEASRTRAPISGHIDQGLASARETEGYMFARVG